MILIHDIGKTINKSIILKDFIQFIITINHCIKYFQKCVFFTNKRVGHIFFFFFTEYRRTFNKEIISINYITKRLIARITIMLFKSLT